jgi:hypothetical protein
MATRRDESPNREAYKVKQVDSSPLTEMVEALASEDEDENADLAYAVGADRETMIHSEDEVEVRTREASGESPG